MHALDRHRMSRRHAEGMFHNRAEADMLWRDRNCMKALAKGHADFAVMEHNAAHEAAANRSFEFVQATKVGRSHRCRCLDFHTGDGTGCLFDDNIGPAGGTVLVPVMEEPGWCVLPIRLPSQLLEHEGLQQIPQQCSVCRQRPRRIGTKQGCSKTGVGNMQFRPSDQPLQSIAVPGRDPLPSRKSLSRSVT